MVEHEQQRYICWRISDGLSIIHCWWWFITEQQLSPCSCKGASKRRIKGYGCVGGGEREWSEYDTATRRKNREKENEIFTQESKLLFYIKKEKGGHADVLQSSTNRSFVAAQYVRIESRCSK